MTTTFASYEDLLPDVSKDVILPILNKLELIARNSVDKTLNGKYAIAYSAGIDSSILAKLASDKMEPATLLTLGREGSSDMLRVEKDSLAKSKRFSLLAKRITQSDIEKAANEVSRRVSGLNLPHFEDCVSFWLAASAAKEITDLEYIASSNGPDELFCGYDRFRRIVDDEGYAEAKSEISRAMESAFKLRRQVGELLSEFGYSTVEPFLEEPFREFSLQIPIEYKILKGDDLIRKRVWRCLGRSVSIPESTVVQRKKAMQYGIGVHPVVLSLIRKKKIKIETNREKNDN